MTHTIPAPKTAASVPSPDDSQPRSRSQRPRSGRWRDRAADPIFNVVAIGMLLLAIVVILYPLYFIVIASVSEPSEILNGNVWLWPQGFTLEGYARIFSDSTIIRAFGNSVLYTVLGTAISVVAILCAAYALSRKDLYGRTFFMLLFIITMFIDGGLIARYLVVRDLGMLDTIWAIVLPGAIGVWNLIIARAFFENNVPAELREAAQLDGANDFRFFLQIVLPLSKPLIFLMIMIHLVANWNAFFDALIFLNDESKYPLQLVLRNVLIQSEVNSAGGTGALDSYAAAQRLGELIKYGMIVVSTIPLLIVLPFMQKHFTKGALLGAVKS
ncbi:carbohydrate ABC transporter permease [Microbacterium sp. cx-55]|uniref:carbohydrate ABC transporter permease n=1 Tax=Microbacterium sp. cx-55 TaxID=2875948 RepID=UPI001CBD5395|nr:carbohydrate ABC transporter permease [Microbacterium sp. cx-55]MBZ4486722.1 carbohydrate ABC transporter permease [Microbacterium sp. cx-55]UGB36318.1 carbohydrate ABC transporter permease [Microbacterium sp. cx-55]